MTTGVATASRTPTVPGPVGSWTRRILLANVVAQVAIVVTGGLVRLTGSGLGCPTWPECTDGSIVPVANQAEGVHKLIEFGNRTLTGVLVLVAGLALLAVSRGWWARFLGGRPAPVRRPLVLLAAAVVAGIVVQAVLGGVTVLVGLHPLTVAGHFLVSMGVVAAAFVLYAKGKESSDGDTAITVRPELRVLAAVLLAWAVVVLVLGTVVTGSGPHSGDADVVVRLPLDPRMVSWLHADVVIAFVGLTVAFWLGARLTSAPNRAQRAALLLLAACAFQGVVGYTQYFTGLPTVLVAAHMLGACLVWIATLALWLSTRAPGGGRSSVAATGSVLD